MNKTLAERISSRIFTKWTSQHKYVKYWAKNRGEVPVREKVFRFQRETQIQGDLITTQISIYGVYIHAKYIYRERDRRRESGEREGERAERGVWKLRGRRRHELFRHEFLTSHISLASSSPSELKYPPFLFLPLTLWWQKLQSTWLCLTGPLSVLSSENKLQLYHFIIIKE